MPDLGHDVKDFKVFTWPLAGWKKLDKKLTSPDFECGGHKWSLSPLLQRLVLGTDPRLCYQADSSLSFR